NTTYNVRVRLAKSTGSAAWVQGAVRINLTSVLAGFTTPGLTVQGNTLTPNFAEFTAQILPARTTIPADLLLQVYVDGTPTLNAGVNIDSIEIYPINLPVNFSTAWFSRAFNPESYDNTLTQI